MANKIVHNLALMLKADFLNRGDVQGGRTGAYSARPVALTIRKLRPGDLLEK